MEEGVYTLGQSDFIKFICNVWAGVLKFSLKFKSYMPWETAVTAGGPIPTKLDKKGYLEKYFWSVIWIIIIVGRKNEFESYAVTGAISSQK